MQAIDVFENGIGYLEACLNLYLGGTSYMLLFFLGALYILLKGNEEEREIFLPATVIMMVTVYNPICPVILDKIFDVSSEYYRFFWITPVIVLVPFVVSKFISGAKDTREKIGLAVFGLVLMILSGQFVYPNGIPFAENIYKIPNELIEIDRIIHADSDDEYVKAFFEYNYNMEIRQYDPKILLTIDREEYIYAVNYSYSDEMIRDENTPTNIILAGLIRGQNVDGEDLKAALDATNTQYVVLTKGNLMSEDLVSQGLLLIGETQNHNIYKNQLDEDPAFGLVDYSTAPHIFSYRRLK